MNQGEITICGRAKAPCVPHESLKQVIPQTYRSCLTGCFCGNGPNCRSGREGACQLGIGFKGTISSANTLLRKITVIDFHHCDKLPKAMSLKREKAQFGSVSEFWSMTGTASLGLWQHTCGRACGGACLLISWLGNERNGRGFSFTVPYITPAFPTSTTLGPKPLSHGPLRDSHLQVPSVSVPCCQMRQGTGKNGRTLCPLQVAFRETQKVGNT